MIWATEELWLDFQHGQGTSISCKRPPQIWGQNGLALMSTGALFPGIKRHVNESGHLPPLGAKINNEWRCSDLPPFAFMVCTKMTLSPLLPLQHNTVTVLTVVLLHFLIVGVSCTSYTERLRKTHRPKEEIVSLFIKFRIRNY
jgi:hypothetical protein